MVQILNSRPGQERSQNEGVTILNIKNKYI